MQHLEYHTKSSDLIADIVIGISDGLTVPFALTVGLSGAVASNPLAGLPYSVVITFICLLIFGWFKSKMTGQPLLTGALKTAAIGMFAAGAAFGIAKMIG